MACISCRDPGQDCKPARKPSLRLLQEIVAPFALENLGCTGTEARLLDCPVADSDEETPAPEYDYNYRFRDYTNSATCDPFAGSFAEVACGTSDAAGVFQPALALTHTSHTFQLARRYLCILETRRSTFILPFRPDPLNTGQRLTMFGT